MRREMQRIRTLQLAKLAAGAATALLASCAAPPNTPGAGSGLNYTPVIDTQGADISRYESDLADCRRLAGSVDESREAVTGIIAGAIAGAVITGALGGGTWRDYDRNATIGGLGQGARAGNSAREAQKHIMINCMAGRGYKALDGTVVTNAYSQPNQGPAYRPVAVAPSNQVAAYTPPPAYIDSRPVLLDRAPEPITQPRLRQGQEVLTVEQMAKAQSCSATPRAEMTAKTPGIETYTVPCDNGDVWSVRCEFSSCKVLR